MGRKRGEMALRLRQCVVLLCMLITQADAFQTGNPEVFPVAEDGSRTGSRTLLQADGAVASADEASDSGEASVEAAVEASDSDEAPVEAAVVSPEFKAKTEELLKLRKSSVAASIAEEGQEKVDN